MKKTSYNELLFKKLGNIIQYDKDGNILRKFDNWKEIIDNYEEYRKYLYIYSFEYFHDQGIIITRQGSTFFNSPVKQLYDQKSYKLYLITNLNIAIKDIIPQMLSDKNINSLSGGCFSSSHDTRITKSYEKNKYKMVKILESELLTDWIISTSSKKRNVNNNNSLYKKNINNLFKRYSIKKTCLFQQVVNLKQFKKISGIYVLEIEKINMCYVGLSKDLYNRIRGHFTRINGTLFDNTYGINDISKVYVMPVPEILLEEIEKDCIAFLNTKILTNILAGGNEIISINDISYKKQHFLLSRLKLKDYKTKIISYQVKVYD